MSEPGWVTIGQLAAYAGVTVRTVRHYEQRGLMAEPARDESGYRRYGAQALTDLVRIRTLAEAGVPLARVREVLDAPAEEFAAAMRQIESELREEAEELERRRARVAALSDGEHGLLPDALARWLDDLRGAGMREETVRLERDGWLLSFAAEPDATPGWIEEKRRSLRDPEFRRLYGLYETTMFGDPTDDEVRALVRQSLDYLERHYSEDEMATMWVDDPDIAAMMFSQATADGGTSWDRYQRIAREVVADHPVASRLPPGHPLAPR